MTKTLLSYYKSAGGLVDINQKTGRGADHLLHAVCRSPDPIDDDILTEILRMSFVFYFFFYFFSDFDLLEFEGIDATCKNLFDETTPLHYFAQHNRSLQCQNIG